MSVTIDSLKPNDRINFSTYQQVAGKATWQDCRFIGHVGYDMVSDRGDIDAIVASTAPHFPAGSPREPSAITYLVVRHPTSVDKIVLPAPLVDKGSLVLVANQIHQVTVRDGISAEQLRQILSGNNLSDFDINTINGG